MPTDARRLPGIMATTTSEIGVLDLKSCRDRVDTEQFISEYDPEMSVRVDVAAILDVGHPTFYDVVVTSPFATGTHIRTEEGKERTTVRRRQSSKPRKKKSSISGRRERKPVVHLVPLAFDVYRRCGVMADKALTDAGRRRPAKKYVLVATRITRALGAKQMEAVQWSAETSKCARSVCRASMRTTKSMRSK